MKKFYHLQGMNHLGTMAQSQLHWHWIMRKLFNSQKVKKKKRKKKARKDFTSKFLGEIENLLILGVKLYL